MQTISNAFVTSPLAQKKSSPIAGWWSQIDHRLFFSFLLLGFIGMILIASAGPSVARRIGISHGLLSAQWWFFTKYMVFLTSSISVMLVLSMLSSKMIRRIGVMICVVSFVLLCLVPIFGSEIKGARRWIFGIQPSEFIKPSFIILSAWLMSISKTRYPILPKAMLCSFVSLLLLIFLFLIQPDFGQTILMTLVWTVMFFISGANLLWFIGISGIGALGVVGGYYSFSHVRNRIDAFLEPDKFDKFGINYQSDIARKAFDAGGFFGRGPGEGEIKNTLPDAHTDYIFAVAGEELGGIVCMMIVGLYAFIILYTFIKAMGIKDYFTRFAITGLICLFGFQAFINIAVNLGIFPPKGMTLPFISYGGSSILATGLLTGFILSLLKNKEPQ